MARSHCFRRLAPVFAVVFAIPALLLFVVSFWSVPQLQAPAHVSLRSMATLHHRILGPDALHTADRCHDRILCTVLGFIFAYAARFKAGRHGDLLMLATLVTLFGGYLVKIYAWKSILGADGLLNQALMLTGLTDAPLAFLIYSRGAVIIALVHFSCPSPFFRLREPPQRERHLARGGARSWRKLHAAPHACDLPQGPGRAVLRLRLLLSSGGWRLCDAHAARRHIGQHAGAIRAAGIFDPLQWPAGSAMSFGCCSHVWRCLVLQAT